MLESESIGIKALVLKEFSMAALATIQEVVFVLIVLFVFWRVQKNMEFLEIHKEHRDRALSVSASLSLHPYFLSLPMFLLLSIYYCVSYKYTSPKGTCLCSIPSLSLICFCQYVKWMGIRAGQNWYYAQTQHKAKHALPKQNNTLACCLVGDSGDCKGSLSMCLQIKYLFSFHTQRPSTWGLLLALGQRDKQVLRKAKSR